MIRYTLPSSGTFLLVCLLINEGLGYLWTVPPQDSWLTLVAIFGHGFVSTALIAAMFHILPRDQHLVEDRDGQMKALKNPAEPEGKRKAPDSNKGQTFGF